ncbi:MAG: biopolymer transporter ExbD [Firmicutes bacterium]|nr:biopolymer transporter ExbD [Bacillota bacterium]
MARYWKRKARIDIVPLVDVFVTLVFFFLVFGYLGEAPAALPVNLPTSRSAAPITTPRLVVVLTEDGEYQVEGRRIKAEEIPRVVAAAVAETPGLQVILAPARSVTYEAVVAALDLLRAGGVERPALGVKREEGERGGG